MYHYNNRMFVFNRKVASYTVSERTIDIALKIVKKAEKSIEGGKFDKSSIIKILNELGLTLGENLSQVVNFLPGVWIFGKDLFEWYQENTPKMENISCN